MRDPLILRSALALITGLLVAQIAIEVIARRWHKDLHEVRIRTRSWWIIVALIEAAFYFGKASAMVFFACVSFLGLREFLSRVPTRVVDRRVLFWVFLAIPLQFYLIYQGWLMAFVCFVPLYGGSVIALRLLLTGQPKGFIMALATFQLALLCTVYSVGHVAFLADLRQGYDFSAGDVLFLICVIQLNDVFQFLSGKSFGKHKIMPHISPKKTVEGFLGGVVLSSLLSFFIAPLITPLTRWEGLLAGATLAVFGFFGDVLMSAIKRDLQVKDFSQIIPGHGGVLDRIDSLVIAAPIYFHLARFLEMRVTH